MTGTNWACNIVFMRRMPAFRALIREYDRDGKFSNTLVNKYLVP
ncbi:MAG: hypothetical protein QOF95_1620 [Pseudonocardiales bacterium]|nr:hypothetical protein [Pseudonocardiales bacterium]